ncbi:hypothetical protein AMTRI_Chr07g25950 [Amborella trichopoda]
MSLKCWRQSRPGNYSKLKSSWLSCIQDLDKIEEVRPLSDSEERLRTQSKLEYLATLKKEDLFGTRDLANYRRRENLISTIKVDNNFLTQPDEIENAILNYFMSLYAALVGLRPRMTTLDFLSVPDLWSSELEKLFTVEEISSTIDQLTKDKAPGPDGFPMASFKSFLGTFLPDFKSLFEEFYHRGILNKAINATFIALVPKKEGAKELKDFRPISLLNSSYKILAKVLD